MTWPKRRSSRSSALMCRASWISNESKWMQNVRLPGSPKAQLRQNGQTHLAFKPGQHVIVDRKMVGMKESGRNAKAGLANIMPKPFRACQVEIRPSDTVIMHMSSTQSIVSINRVTQLGTTREEVTEPTEEAIHRAKIIIEMNTRLTKTPHA